MSVMIRTVCCVFISVILSNVGCVNREEQILADNADAGNALVAIGTDDDGADASVEGM